MHHWKLTCFGPPRLEKEGVEVQFSQRKDMALFVYLAVTGQVVPPRYAGGPAVA